MNDLPAAFATGIDALRNGPPAAVTKAASEPEARKAAQEFEALFLAQMIEQMFAGVSTDGPFGGGQAEPIYRSMLVQEYGKILARSGGLGIADKVTREILSLQEVQ